MKTYVTLIVILFSFSITAVCQIPTIGLIQNDANSFNGYTLFAPNSSSKSYLIDNCGNMVNSWQGSSQPALSTYLLRNGNLLRTARTNNPIFSGSGGAGGRVELYDWNSTLLWSYNYSDSIHHQHHDVEYLPNGNILILAWDAKTVSESMLQGRNPSLLGTSLWSEHIIEIEPSGTNGGTIVWEWYVWDHLVQDFDSTKSNFGVVSNHPELINLNFANGSNQDWLHINSVQYNATLDQILLSIHNSGEIWVIDHSTSTAEAASHSGGNSGKGGDLLYRWGNPRAYQRGLSADQKLFGQHDAQWIEDGLADSGKIMVFNNGINRPGGNYSSIDVIAPLLDSANKYLLNGSSAFGPDTLSWQYVSTPTSAFYSSNISGAQRLENGNTLICEGSSGNFFEIDSNKNIVWNYINPVNQAGPLNQGSNPVGNAVFRAYRYAPDYSGLLGQTLISGQPIELNPYISNCTLYTSGNDLGYTMIKNEYKLFPNPVINELNIESYSGNKFTVTISDTEGRTCKKIISGNQSIIISLLDLSPGIYFVDLSSKDSRSGTRIVKL